MAQMIQCDNSRRPPHYFPPQEKGTYKIVNCSEFVIEPIEWEEKDFCSLVCLAIFAAAETNSTRPDPLKREGRTW